MLRYTVLTALLLIALTGTAFGQVSLQWKFKESDTFYLEEKCDSKGTVGDQQEKQKRDVSYSRLWHFVVKSHSSTATVLEGRIESWILKDNDDPKYPNEFRRWEQAAKELVFTLHLAPAGALTKIEGVDSFVAKLESLRKTGNIGKIVITDAMFLETLPLAFDVFADAPVKVGDTWKRNGAVSGGTTNLKLAMMFEYVDPGKGAARCSMKAAMSFEPFTTYYGDIWRFQPKAKEAKGEIVFDTTKGRLVSFELITPQVGTITVERDSVQVLQLPVDVVNTQTLRVYDKKPVADQ